MKKKDMERIISVQNGKAVIDGVVTDTSPIPGSAVGDIKILHVATYDYKKDPPKATGVTVDHPQVFNGIGWATLTGNGEKVTTTT